MQYAFEPTPEDFAAWKAAWFHVRLPLADSRQGDGSGIIAKVPVRVLRGTQRCLRGRNA
jgi:hypothetical protein